MATIVTRAGKGLPLTNAEVDANFTNLNNQLATALFGANNLSDLANVSTARSNLGVAIGTNVQAWDADLDAIAALTGTSGLLKKTAANTWSLDTTVYANTAGTYADPSWITSLASSKLTGIIAPATLGTGTANSTTFLRGDNTWQVVSVPVTSVFGRTGAVTLTSADVTGALGYTPPTPTGTGASGTWGINVTGSSGTAGTATYLSATAQTNVITGKTQSMAMSTTDTSNNGSFVIRAGGTGDANLAGISFWNDNYAIKMGVRADGYFGLGGWSRAAWSWYSDPSGNMVAAGNVTAYSDERKKKNWRDLPEDFVELLAGVKHGIYDRTDEELTQVGVSAQSLQGVMPHAVVTGIDGWLAVSYGPAAMVASVQLAQKYLSLLERVKQLEQKVLA